ncbi:MAG: sulfotransferase family protein [Pseudomonadota bacterium]
MLQQRELDMLDMVNCIQVDPYDVSRIVLIVSPCRSGSTVMLRVFGASDIVSHFQVLKNTLRWRMQGEIRPWQIPHGHDKVIVLKETLGPFTDEECRFNPLQLLLQAGYPADRLKIVILSRDPFQTWASWQRWWGKKTNPELFIKTYLCVEELRKQADLAGINLTCLCYDIFRDHYAGEVLGKLFYRLGLVWSSRVLEGWNNLPSFGDPGSNIVLPEEPFRFVTSEIHDHVIKSDYFRYTPRDIHRESLDSCILKKFDQNGLANLYDTWLHACRQDLDFHL